MTGLALLILLFVLIVVFLAVSAILGFVAFIRQCRTLSLGSLWHRLAKLEERVKRLEEPDSPAGAAEKGEERPAAARLPVIHPEEAVKPLVREAPAEQVSKESGKSLWGGLEKAIGEKWIAWAGVVVIFLAVAFFIKHAIDMGWLGPTGRCILGAMTGIVLIVFGDVCLRRGMRAPGQGMIGGGLAVLYLTVFAAFSFYDLLPAGFAFGFMIAVTAAGMALAVLHDALAVAFIAALGGFLTPVLCATGQDRRDVLFAYMTVLNLGVLGVALFRRWRSLDALAFAATWLLFGAWYGAFYTDRALVPAMCWLLVFFAVFLLLPFGYHLRTGRSVPVERFLMAVANAGVVFGFAAVMLYPDSRRLLGFVALGMAVCYSALGKGMKWKVGGGRDVLGFVALAMIFLTMAVPLHMGLHGTLIIWVAEAAALLYLGCRFRYLPVRLGAFAVLCVAVFRFFTVHWPLHEMDFLIFWNISFGTALCLPLGGAVFVWLYQRLRGLETPLDRALQQVAAVGSCLLFLLILQSEIGLWLVRRGGDPNGFDGEYLARFARSVICTAGSVLMLAGGIRWRSPAVRLAAMLPLAAALADPLGMYSGRLPAAPVLFLNLRFAAALSAVLAVFVWGRWLRGSKSGWERGLSAFLNWAGIFLLLCFLSAEVWHFASSPARPAARARWAGQMSLSLTWGIYAIALLAAGFLQRRRPVRLAALGLFGVTGFKLVLVDMAGVEDFYRIISFLVIGVLMVGASYLYHKAERRIQRKEGG